MSNAFTNTSTGTFALEGTAELTVTGAFTNSGALELDIVSGNGGSGLTIGGTLANTGTVQIGPNDYTLSAATTVTLGGLTNGSGASFVLYGLGEPRGDAGLQRRQRVHQQQRQFRLIRHRAADP